MKRFRNIVYVAEPLADQSAAMARAVALAENSQARLTVLRVVDPPRLGAFARSHSRDELESLLRQQETARLESLVAPFRSRVEVSLDLRFGTPFIEVVRDVIRHQRDLVIKTACTEEGVRHRLFGSTDMHLLRKCPCPVWLLHPDTTQNYRRILAAVDFDPWQPEAGEGELNRFILELAGSLALSDFAELHVVHVWDTMAEGVMRVWGGELDDASLSAYVESERVRHQEGFDRLDGELRALLGEEAYGYLSPRLHLRQGVAREVIPALTKEIDADLIVMGTVARTGIPGFIIGNTAEGVLNRIGCAVLAVKPPGFISPVTLP